MKTNTGSIARRNRVLDGTKMLGLIAGIISLSIFGGQPAGAQNTMQEAEGTVEIWLNNTADTNNDAVAQGGSLPCQIHLKNAQKDMNVVLVVPPISGTTSRRVSLSALNVTTNADGSLPLALTKDGTWKSFSINGSVLSSSVNDTVISVRKDTSNGDVKTYASTTVWRIDTPEMFVTTVGNYVAHNPTDLDGNPDTSQLLASLLNGEAAKFSANVHLLPSGLSAANIPSLKDRKIAIVQNALSGSGVSMQWDVTAPTLPINPATAQAPISASQSRTLPNDANDSSGSGPTYDSLVGIGQGPLISGDTPQTAAPTFIFKEGILKSDGGTTTVAYNLQNSILI